MRSALLAGAALAMTLGQAVAGVKYGGVNIAGFDFGCVTTGECNTTKVVPPLHEYKGKDGAKQMQHFVKDDKLNAFRMPVAWQYLVEKPGAPLIPANMKKYDALVKACLATGSLCIIDIHNYARWDGQIIGQGGPTDEEFADLWSQLATQYKSQSKVAMGIINEPHEVPDITRWAKTCQTVVDAIRKAGAIDHYILLPGNGYTSAGTFVSSGSAKALLRVKDADGSTDKLIFEVHKYLDEDNSGTHLDCVSNNIDAFEDLTKFLKDNKRQAILAEVGGGPSTKSCLKNVCELLSYLNDNDDVYMGYLGWGAGSFDETYALSLTPEGGDGDEAMRKTPMKDVPLMTECFVKLFSGGAGTGGSYSGGNSTNSTTGQSSSNSTSEESSSGNYDSGSTGESSDQPSSSTPEESSTGSNSGDLSDDTSDQPSSSTPKESSGKSSDQPSSSTSKESSGESLNQAGGKTGGQDAGQAGSQGGGEEAKQSQGSSTESQESTPGGVQNAPGSEKLQNGTAQVASKSAQHKTGETGLDVVNEDEIGDDVCKADEEAETGEENKADEEDNKSEVEKSPQPAAIPRPSSTFATSYIPTPSAPGSPGTGTLNMGGSSTSSDNSSGGSDLSKGVGSYA
ncbi:MAG: hypothetical protein L6R42_003226 [Xanthoria sp. 1 TBL-2021]|nr:MAG: hypothetical protein L6R42_003226 [Xanthoria sp. 1 TBL-2021]